jgi:hypothetical protein
MRSAIWKAGAFALAAVAGLGGTASAASVGSAEYTQFLPVWLSPGPGTPDHPVPALLNLPAGWQAGDAAVVVARGRDAPQELRDQLISAIIDAGAAVLELHVEPGREATLPAGFADALVTLRGGFGAGLVAAVGYGWGAAATLGAVEATHPGIGGYNAAVVLDAGAPRLARGEMPPAGEAWPVRAPMFCAVLATGLGAMPAGFVEGCARELTLAGR